MEDGSLDISVFRKQTHTDRYLHFKSYHPAHVKRGLIRCLFNRAKAVTLSQSNILCKERKHLCKVLNINGYPRHFISNATAQTRKLGETETDRVPRTTITIPYIAGVSEEIRRVCWDYDVRVAFKTGRTLHTKLTKVKDPLPLEKQATVVYRIPCSCGKVYIGKTIRRMESRLKEHKDACSRGQLEKSAIAEHAWRHDHRIEWDDAAVIDRASRNKELLREGSAAHSDGSEEG